MRVRRHYATTVVLGAALLVLAGCGSGEGGQQATAGDATGGGAFPRAVTHAMGEAEIPAQPKTIVALDNSFIDAAYSLQTPVAGFTTFDGSKELPGYLVEEFPDLAAQARYVGTLKEPNLERIAAMQPDLIISAKVRHEQIYDELSRIAPTVFSETTGATWKDNLRLLAESTGKQDRAQQRLADYERRAQAIGDAIREKVGHNPTISIVRFVGSGPMRMYYKSSFAGVVLQDAGLARPPSQDVSDPEKIMTEVSEERILDADADHIFMTVYNDPSGAAEQDSQRFRGNPLWGQLTGEVHEVSDTAWMTAVGLQGAHLILDDLAKAFDVDPAR
ncbi:MAG: ABC transporter substrate-binding protein [Pseudonocardiaceae bacterium]|nr:ABC transporter substrate-binding protein [Pseudonocardiaceae bacterium]